MAAHLYLDANILIYVLEETAYTQPSADHIAAHIERGGSLISSTVTLTELIAGAVQDAAATLYRMSMLQLIAVDTAIAEQAGLLRRQHNLKPLDALHLATALQAQAEQLFTNDKPFAKIAEHYLPVMEL